MADELFPTFDFPEIEDNDLEEEKYSPSVYFDYEKGDFILDGTNNMVIADGKEAFIQWCIKTVYTERGKLLAYDDDIGVEFEQLAYAPSREEKEVLIIDSITDALSVHPAFESADDFEFAYLGDECCISFIVKGSPWNEETMSITIPQ